MFALPLYSTNTLKLPTRSILALQVLMKKPGAAEGEVVHGFGLTASHTQRGVDVPDAVEVMVKRHVDGA